MSELQEAVEEGESGDDYHGNSGWVVVFGGLRGRSVFVDVDPGFGACRFWLDEMGMGDPDEAGLGPPDVGFWMARAVADFSKDYESGHSELDGFSVDSWHSVSPSGTGWKPDEVVR